MRQTCARERLSFFLSDKHAQRQIGSKQMAAGVEIEISCARYPWVHLEARSEPYYSPDEARHVCRRGTVPRVDSLSRYRFPSRVFFDCFQQLHVRIFSRSYRRGAHCCSLIEQTEFSKSFIREINSRQSFSTDAERQLSA